MPLGNEHTRTTILADDAGIVNLRNTSMASALRIQCIMKRHRPGPHERIEAVGGIRQLTMLGSEERWLLSEEQAIFNLRAGINTFFTHEGGRTADVRIGKHTVNGQVHYYLTTEPDGYRPNNLLSLGTCPLPVAGR